jgi:hypothetical protein
MFRLGRTPPLAQPEAPTSPSERRLPLRWAVILLGTLGGAAVVAAAAGAVAAIGTGVAVALALHQMID